MAETGGGGTDIFFLTMRSHLLHPLDASVSFPLSYRGISGPLQVLYCTTIQSVVKCTSKIQRDDLPTREFRDQRGPCRARVCGQGIFVKSCGRPHPVVHEAPRTQGEFQLAFRDLAGRGQGPCECCRKETIRWGRAGQAAGAEAI